MIKFPCVQRDYTGTWVLNIRTCEISNYKIQYLWWKPLCDFMDSWTKRTTMRSQKVKFKKSCEVSHLNNHLIRTPVPDWTNKHSDHCARPWEIRIICWTNNIVEGIRRVSTFLEAILKVWYHISSQVKSYRKIKRQGFISR